jgi:hypothetical protein
MPRPVLLRLVFSALFVALAIHRPTTAQPAPPAPSLSDVIDTTLAQEDFQGAIWGVVVRNLESGYTLYERNPHTLFTPASNTKLFTTAAVLEQLGPDYRYRTDVFAEGALRDSVLDGNLIVRGSGDPTIGGHEQEDDPTGSPAASSATTTCSPTPHWAMDGAGTTRRTTMPRSWARSRSTRTRSTSPSSRDPLGCPATCAGSRSTPITSPW